MKNPCEDCLIKVMCSKLCASKKLYRASLNNRLERLRNSFPLSRSSIPGRLAEYTEVNRKIGEHILEVGAIYKRAGRI